MPGPVKGKFTFKKPESVNVIGSYQLGTLCKQQVNIDVAVQLPKVCWNEIAGNLTLLHKYISSLMPELILTTKTHFKKF